MAAILGHTSMTDAPASAKPAAMARPMPFDTPVTSATWPPSLLSIDLFADRFRSGSDLVAVFRQCLRAQLEHVLGGEHVPARFVVLEHLTGHGQLMDLGSSVGQSHME